MRERQLLTNNFSWSKKQAAPQPCKEKENQKTKKVKRRRLTANMITLHHKPNNRAITLNKELSLTAHEYGFTHFSVDEYGGKMYIVLTRIKLSRVNYAKISYNKQKDSIHATISSKVFTSAICNHYQLEEGDYYFRISEDEYWKNRNEQKVFRLEDIVEGYPKANMAHQSQTKCCSKCGRELPISQFYRKGKNSQSWCIDCCKEHGRLRNGATGEYRITISEASDQQLYNELKRRGYEGELYKRQILK